MTALYNDIIFGPVQSRRLGLSLGVNLLPTHSKLCNFDCIYCECGWNDSNRGAAQFNDADQVIEALSATLQSMSAQGRVPNVITFAGNGEPTLHPQFEQIIERTIATRDLYAPSAKVSVLSNATRLGHQSVRRALLRVDNNILKLDGATDEIVRAMNNPHKGYSVDEVVSNMLLFEGRLIVQTMFLRGECNGTPIDNTTPEAIEAWLKLIQKIAPRSVMVYSIDRDTPCQTLQKVSREQLEQIAAKVRQMGVECSVA